MWTLIFLSVAGSLAGVIIVAGCFKDERKDTLIAWITIVLVMLVTFLFFLWGYATALGHPTVATMKDGMVYDIIQTAQFDDKRTVLARRLDGNGGDVRLYIIKDQKIDIQSGQKYLSRPDDKGETTLIPLTVASASNVKGG